MGKNLIQQARGKGGPTYRSPSHRFKGTVKFRPVSENPIEGTIVDLLHCAGHSSPLAQIKFDDGVESLNIAAEGLRVGDRVAIGDKSEIRAGNSMQLKNIPEGTPIFNIETHPGDGGRLIRASGLFAKIMVHSNTKSVIKLPSKKQIEVSNLCRATIGVISGGQRTEKPFLKAGRRFHRMKAKNKIWPIVSGSAMNAVDHPFGNSRSSRKSKARPAPHNAPPGRNVGMIRPRRTGRVKK